MARVDPRGEPTRRTWHLLLRDCRRSAAGALRARAGTAQSDGRVPSGRNGAHEGETIKGIAEAGRDALTAVRCVMA